MAYSGTPRPGATRLRIAPDARDMSRRAGHPCPTARDFPQGPTPREVLMTSKIGIVAALAVAAFALAATAAQAEIKKEWVDYSHGEQKLKGYLTYDDKITGKRPAILMIHDRAGMQ